MTSSGSSVLLRLDELDLYKKNPDIAEKNWPLSIRVIYAEVIQEAFS